MDEKLLKLIPLAVTYEKLREINVLLSESKILYNSLLGRLENIDKSDIEKERLLGFELESLRNQIESITKDRDDLREKRLGHVVKAKKPKSSKTKSIRIFSSTSKTLRKYKK